jgi:hypothetical protein
LLSLTLSASRWVPVCLAVHHSFADMSHLPAIPRVPRVPAKIALPVLKNNEALK